MRVADGDAVDITGATSSTYTLTSTDVGDSIQLQAAFTDDRDNTESITSAVTASVIASGATRELLWLSTMTPEDPDGLDTDFNFDSVANQGSLSPAAFTDGADTRAITFLGASFGSNTTLALELGSEPSTAQTATWRLALHDTELAFDDATMTQTGSRPPAYRFQWDATALAVDDTDLWDDGDAFTVSLLKAVNLSATGVPTIDGMPQVGETLTAAITGITDGKRARRRLLRLPVDGWRLQHRRRHRFEPHPDLQPGRPDHPGTGLLQRRRRLLRNRNQRGNRRRRSSRASQQSRHGAA